MNLTEMVTFVRTQVDADEDDAPLASLELYAKNAVNDIKRRRLQWPHTYVEYTLTTVADQAEYDLADLSTTDMEWVLGVWNGSNGQLPIITRKQALEFYGVSPETGTVEAVSIGPDSIRLYPTPSANGDTLLVTGYREFASWPPESGNAEPDLPREFDIAVCWAMCRDFWLGQEEMESAQAYDARYERTVRQGLEQLNRSIGSTAGPSFFTGPRSSRGRVTYEQYVKWNLR